MAEDSGASDYIVRPKLGIKAYLNKGGGITIEQDDDPGSMPGEVVLTSKQDVLALARELRRLAKEIG